MPAGTRRGGFGLDAPTGAVLHNRLRQHASSIQQVQNLDLTDFTCRYLVVDDIWIPLGERLLIERYHPVWNLVIDGFGNHPPGAGRRNQRRSSWDVLHPGRP
ncbi:MAG: Eco29kI family restriction endonuclease [Chloroflexia bacterium]